MCTLTLLREPHRTDTAGRGPLWRLVFNRDEQRRRPEALPPAEQLCGSVRTLYPVDPQGGGTWIAATEHGVVFAVLNGADPAPGAADPRALGSRGEIIPALVTAAVRRAGDVPVETIESGRYRPFHLVIADDAAIIEVSSDGRTLRRTVARTDPWLMRTSSSFASDAVCDRRQGRFDAVATPVSALDQDAFHAQTEPDRPAFGVAMSRPDACTVSTTVVDVFAGVIRMTYRGLGGSKGLYVTELQRAP